MRALGARADAMKGGVPATPHSQTRVYNNLFRFDQRGIRSCDSRGPIDFARLSGTYWNEVQQVVGQHDYQFCAGSHPGRGDSVDIGADSVGCERAETQAEVPEHIYSMAASRDSNLRVR